MAERLPREIRLQREQSFKDYIDTTISKWSAVTTCEYDNPEKASHVLRRVVDELREGQPDMSDCPKPTLLMSGSGIKVPNFQINKTEDGLNLYVANEMRPLGDMEERTGHYQANRAYMYKTDDGQYKLMSELIFRNAKKGDIVITSDDNNILMSMVAEEYMKYNCDGSPVDFRFLYLENEQEREIAYREIALSGIGSVQLQRTIDELDKALQEEDDNTLMALDVTLLHRIAKHGERFAKHGDRYEDMATSLVLRTLGKGRVVHIGVRNHDLELVGQQGVQTIDVQDQQVGGRLLDVVMRKGIYSTDDRPRQLSFALESGEGDIFYAPLDQLNNFMF